MALRLSKGTSTAATMQSVTPAAVRVLGETRVRARLATERLASRRAPVV
jgi:hypothetical protein